MQGNTNIFIENYDLSVKNPNKKEDTTLRSPKDILNEIQAIDRESAEILKSIEGLI
jgi:type I restriction enzyme M protein